MYLPTPIQRLFWLCPPHLSRLSFIPSRMVAQQTPLSRLPISSARKIQAISLFYPACRLAYVNKLSVMCLDEIRSRDRLEYQLWSGESDLHAGNTSRGGQNQGEWHRFCSLSSSRSCGWRVQCSANSSDVHGRFMARLLVGDHRTRRQRAEHCFRLGPSGVDANNLVKISPLVSLTRREKCPI